MVVKIEEVLKQYLQLEVEDRRQFFNIVGMIDSSNQNRVAEKFETRQNTSYINKSFADENAKLKALKESLSNKNKPWTTEETKKLIELYKNENTTKAIARILGRTTSGVASHFCIVNKMLKIKQPRINKSKVILEFLESKSESGWLHSSRSVAEALKLDRNFVSTRMSDLHTQGYLEIVRREVIGDSKVPMNVYRVKKNIE